MFQQSYTRKVMIQTEVPCVDEYGFVYHSIGLDGDEKEHDSNAPVLSYGLMLPNIWKEVGEEVAATQYAIVDKEWRFMNAEFCWTHL
jgi:hypothetical protein